MNFTTDIDAHEGCETQDKYVQSKIGFVPPHVLELDTTGPLDDLNICYGVLGLASKRYTVKCSVDIHRGDLLWLLSFLGRSCTSEGRCLILPIMLQRVLVTLNRLILPRRSGLNRGDSVSIKVTDKSDILYDIAYNRFTHFDFYGLGQRLLKTDVYAAIDSCETAKEIWERVRQMMKGSDIGEQEKKAKLFDEWEKFTSTDGESIESYYHRFMQLMNDLKRNKHFPENIASNLKFLNNLQPEWKRHVTIVRQTKNLYETDFTQIYDFLKMNQEEVNELRAERLAKYHDPLALMAHSQDSFNFPITHKDQSSSSTHPQQSFPIINKIQGAQNAGVQSDKNQNGLVFVPGIANQSGTGNVVTARVEGTGNGNQAKCYNCRGLGIQLQAEEFDFMAAAGDLDKIEERSNCSDHAPKPDSFYHPNQKMALGYPNPSYLKKAQLKQQSLYNGNLLLEEHDPPAVYDSEETLELAQESHEKIRLLKKEIKPANYAKINHLSGVFVPQTTKYKEELFLSNVSNVVTASKMISIPNEDLSDDTTPSVARKFLNEVKSSLVTLQRVVKQKMNLKVHNWSSSAHKEVYRIISHEIAPIINQVDARVQNFEIQFLQEVAKFVRDFKSLAKEADESLDEQKSLELEIERLLKASISYDKAYNDMQQKVERLQAQLRDLKGKSSNTPSASNTLDPLNQKLETKIVELEFQVVNYERDISHLKTTYKNLFNSIKSNWAHTKLHDLIFENAKLRARLFENASESVKNTARTSVTPHVDKPKLSAVTPHSKKLHASTQSHSIPQTKEFNVVKHRNVIAPGMFKINSS
nr:hypothetical protein [Tanacetum cinerariifolium]